MWKFLWANDFVVVILSAYTPRNGQQVAFKFVECEAKLTENLTLKKKPEPAAVRSCIQWNITSNLFPV